MPEKENGEPDRIVRESYLDRVLSKYPTRWEMIAYLGGAVLANRFVSNLSPQGNPVGLVLYLWRLIP